MKNKSQTKEERGEEHLQPAQNKSSFKSNVLIMKGGFFLILGIVLGVQWRMQGLEEYPENHDGRMVKTLQNAF